MKSEGDKMKKQYIALMTISTMFFASNAVFAAGTGTKTRTTSTAQSKMQAKTQERTQMQERVLDQAKLDLQLRDRVQEQLRLNIKDFDQDRLMIMSHNGDVTLDGIAKNREQARIMEQEAMKVRGVNRVHNNLAIDVE